MSEIPLEFLFDSSDQTLVDLRLASLDRGARNLKAARAAWNAAVEEFANAELAQYFKEHRQEILAMARRTVEAQSVLVFPERKRA